MILACVMSCLHMISCNVTHETHLDPSADADSRQPKLPQKKAATDVEEGELAFCLLARSEERWGGVSVADAAPKVKPSRSVLMAHTAHSTTPSTASSTRMRTSRAVGNHSVRRHSDESHSGWWEDGGTL